MSIPSEVAAKVQAAFLAADDVIREQPNEFHDEIIDVVLDWALRQYLPCSKHFAGIYVYAIHPDDRIGDQSVKIIPAILDNEIVVLQSEGLPL